MAILAVAGLAALRSLAQEEKPQIIPQRNRPQDNKKIKKGKEARAVGVLQLSGNGKGTLIPVAILINGRFYDASAYKADPVPMALESGTVYEAEQAGDSQGLFTINGALHSKSPGSADPWVASGTFLPQGAEAAKTTHKAEDVPVGLDNSGDEPPRLTRKDASKPATTPDSSSTPTAGSSSSEKPGATTPPASDKPAAKDDKQQTPASQTGSEKGSSPASASASPSSSSSSSESSGDYYRPTLRRGKPTQSAPVDVDEMATKKDGKTESATTTASAGTGLVRMVAAVSDAAGPQPQSYKFFWKTGEEEERRNQMLALAADEVHAYVNARAKGVIAAKPAPKAAAGRKAPAKQAQPVLENIQFRGFDVWLTNQPVMILSAEAHTPAALAAEPYSVMLVARTDIYGNLQKLYSGVTDKFHLDVTPRLELIDVVDADGDGRGELLFRETSDAGSGYAIYRATADKLWKMFDSLNAE